MTPPRYCLVAKPYKLNKKLNVMDTTAISLCMEENIPIKVFNILEKGNLRKVILDEEIGTIVK